MSDERNQDPNPAQEAMDAFTGRRVKAKAPIDLTMNFPFLDQPGLQCPALMTSLADGIILELEEYRKKRTGGSS